MKKISMVSLLVFISLFVSGCSFVGFMAELGCGFASGLNRDHCYKWSAVKQNDPDVCDKIEGKSEEKGIAPKNQCYEDIAINKNDAEICNRIKEVSLISTTPQRCVFRVAARNKDPSLCDVLEDSDSSVVEQCKIQAGSTQAQNLGYGCVDGDGQFDEHKASYVISGKDGQKQQDYCLSSTELVEYYCDYANHQPRTIKMVCAGACENGACKGTERATVPITQPGGQASSGCFDPDGGLNYATASEVQEYFSGYVRSLQDTCVSEKKLKEYFCPKTIGATNFAEYECRDKCRDGMCVSST